ncbi:putative inner membrane transporter YhbE [Oxobacter pfennigii]|uniref:Putative inner membrane transporter YhbE n=1 Tax=Oxobacter pfennigii TaxID=36849 RepID=A0A0P8YET3_9CLOT|nr:DMT family transporter [Oxobacter pfennigii]KPU45684.1 putative inner membrane transporter YhbE [Oxobacter pfennigii]
MNKYRVWLLLVLCNLFWAGNYVLGKYIVAEMTPLWLTFSRWFIASLLLLIIAYFTEKPSFSAIKKEWFLLLIMGVLGVICYNLILYSALDYTSSTNASMINSLNPGIMAVFSVIFLKEKFSPLQASGVAVSLIGVFVILTQGNLDKIFEINYNRGDLLMLLAISIWTAYSVIVKKLKFVPPITATAVSSLFAVIILSPFAIAEGIDFTKISSTAILGIIFLIFFPSVCSFIFWNISIREIGASKAGVFLNLIPVFTVIITLFLGQDLSMSQIIGGLLVFAGVYVTTGALDKKLVNKGQ